MQNTVKISKPLLKLQRQMFCVIKRTTNLNIGILREVADRFNGITLYNFGKSNLKLYKICNSFSHRQSRMVNLLGILLLTCFTDLFQTWCMWITGPQVDVQPDRSVAEDR